MKTVPPGFESGMNFGADVVDLNLAAALKPKVKSKDDVPASVDILDAADSVIDLADLLKEKATIFKWISEDYSSSQSTFLKS